MLFGKGKRRDGPTELPAGLCNLHSHILFGVDDGAKTEEQMYELIKLEYSFGVRHLCFTPHYNPALFEPKPRQIAESFDLAKKFVQENLPDMKLYLGNEVFMRPDTIDRLRDNGYIPLLAHIERYDKLDDPDNIYELKSLGAYLQINTAAFETSRRKLVTKLLEQGAVDVVSDDRHNETRGDPPISESCSFIAERFGYPAAEAVFVRRPLRLLGGEEI